MVNLVSLGWGAVGAQVIRWNVHGDTAHWTDAVVLVVVALVACGALWLYLDVVVPAAVEDFHTVQAGGEPADRPSVLLQIAQRLRRGAQDALPETASEPGVGVMTRRALTRILRTGSRAARFSRSATEQAATVR